VRIYQPFKEADAEAVRRQATRKIMVGAAYTILGGIGLYLAALALWFGLGPLGAL
jgi:multidrug transporter EmrE-like cation transporter